MEYIQNIIDTTLSSFDFAYCLVVNILTYIIIKLIISFKKYNDIKTWTKRLILLESIIVVSIVYYFIGKPLDLLINSSILAPVFWSWIFKPICKKIGIDYKQVDDTINK